MGANFVKVYGEKVFLDENGFLDLRRKKISDMRDIIGLENIEGLKGLELGNWDENDNYPYTFKSSYNTFKKFRIYDSFRNLIYLDLGYNLDLEFFPEDLDQLEFLEKLSISSKSSKNVPDNICNLYNLRELVFTVCPLLEYLPKDILISSCAILVPLELYT